jgi:1-pyrroline-4-hydroxy-2-carboxylate deaminase
MAIEFPGIIPAAITPFTADDRVDVEALKRNLEALLDAGIGGLVATGTMGEAGQLSDDERRLVTATLVEAADGRVPVVAGVSAGSTSAVRKNVSIAREAGASAVMCLPPYNYPGTLGELIAFYADVARDGLPIMLYNNPGASGIDLTPDVIGAIGAAVPDVVAVKECSGDARRIAQLVNDTSLEILVGGDDWALEGFATGATGWVSGVANVAPAECVALQRHVEAGELAAARAVYATLLPLARLDMTPHLVQYFKGAMDAVGLRGGAVRGPRQPLDAEQQALLDAAMTALGRAAVGAGA